MRTILFASAVILGLNSMHARVIPPAHLPSEGLITASISNDKTLKSSPEKVTIYLQGAQVYRTAAVNLVKGDNYIVFEGLENNIDPASIQAGGNGNYIITEVQHVVKYPELEKVKIAGDNKFQRTIKQINDSMELIGYMLEDAQNRMEVLQTEKNVLLNYSLYKGQSKKDSISFLKEGMTFLREKLNNIYSEILKIKKEQSKLNETSDKLSQRLEEVQNELGQSTVVNDKNKPDYRISLTISADAPGQASLSLNYYVMNAGWTPLYDLRTNGADKGVLLTYKANIKQMSGVDWHNVKLTLSTGNPKQNFIIPELSQWYLEDVYSHHKYPSAGKAAVNSNTTMFAAPSANGAYDIEYDSKTVTLEKDIQFSYDYTEVDQNMIQAEFEIKLPYTIPSDNKNHTVSVNQKELPTNYVYKTVPKVDPAAYLTARVAGWEDMNLLPGNATIYFDGTYVGQTFLNTGVVSDTLELSLGQDKNVMVKRIKVKDKTKEKMIDNDKLYTYVYDIMLRNGNAKPIKIEIIDQLPLSRNKNIAIEKINLDDADYDETSGKITWRETLRAKDNKKISFGYTIKAPKDVPIALK